MILMGKYIIQYEREGCIGAAACVSMDPKNWILDLQDNKANLISGTFNEQTGLWEKEIDESELESAINGAKACPVLVIHVINKETGEKIF